MKLFEIAAEFDALDTLLQETGGEVTPEIQDLLTSLIGLEAEKIDRYGMFLRSLEHEAEGYKQVAAEFTAKRTARENAIKRLKEYLKAYMETQGQTQIKGKLYTAAIQKNGGKPPVLVLVAPNDLPTEYQRVSVDANVEALRTALETNPDHLDGMAALGEVGTHVRIR